MVGSLRALLSRGGDARTISRRGAARRAEERVPTELRAQIVCGGVAIDCMIRDISPRGAKIRLMDGSDIPDQFELVFRDSGRTRPARVRWRKKAEIGIVFIVDRRTFGRREVPPPLPRAPAGPVK